MTTLLTEPLFHLIAFTALLALAQGASSLTRALTAWRRRRPTWWERHGMDGELLLQIRDWRERIEPVAATAEPVAQPEAA